MTDKADNAEVRFENLVGQDRVREILSRGITRKRLPHAFLFLGPDGVGKEAAALDLAKTLLCRSDHQRRGQTPEVLPCGKCDSCTQFAKLAHHSLRLIFPLPKPKEGSTDEAAADTYTGAQQKQIEELLAAKANDPYTPLIIPGGQEILIEHVRALRQEFRLTSFSGGWRVVILSQADRLRVEAANAFLKLLEEPPDDVMFILTSSHESRLLSTIVSRCQVLRFQQLPINLIMDELKTRFKANEEKAAYCARLSGGSWHEAVRWLGGDPSAEMQKVVDFLRELVRGDPGVRDNLVDTWAQAGSGEFTNLLVLTSKWLRDVQKYLTSPDEHPELGQDAALVKFARFTAGRDFSAAIEEVENARLDLMRNVQPALVAHRLFLHLWRKLFDSSSATV